MDIKDSQQYITRVKNDLKQYIERELPVKAGAKAKSIIQENFRLGGFQNGNLTKWVATKRQLSGQGADSKRGPLLSVVTDTSKIKD